MLDSARRNKRHPYTSGFMEEIDQQLNLEVPLNAAVFACLTTCFYVLVRLSEFTVHTLTGLTSMYMSPPETSHTSKTAMVTRSLCYTSLPPNPLVLRAKTYTGPPSRETQTKTQLSNPKGQV